MKPLNAAIYIRKSRKDKDKFRYHLALQREQLPAYALSQGWRAEMRPGWLHNITNPVAAPVDTGE